MPQHANITIIPAHPSINTPPFSHDYPFMHEACVVVCGIGTQQVLNTMPSHSPPHYLTINTHPLLHPSFRRYHPNTKSSQRHSSPPLFGYCVWHVAVWFTERTTQEQKAKARQKYLVPPRFELRSRDPESPILTLILWGLHVESCSKFLAI